MQAASDVSKLAHNTVQKERRSVDALNFNLKYVPVDTECQNPCGELQRLCRLVIDNKTAPLKICVILS
jgi:hypothetical protein